MNELFSAISCLGLSLSLIAYFLGLALRKRFKLAILNPLLISIILLCFVLSAFKIDYITYKQSAKYLSFLLTPATVSLAVPLYRNLSVLKKNFKAVSISLFVGILTSLASVLIFVLVFGFNHKQYVTLLPKSITTAIGMSVSEQLGGYVSITVAIIIITGVIGSIIAEPLYRLTKVVHPISKGLGLGASAHAIGTSKAVEMGEIQGAMSSLAIVFCGVFTVIFANIFASLF